MEPKDRTKEVTFSNEAHLRVHEGVEIMRQAVGSTYGPGGRNVLIQKKYVHPVLTRDGVTVARDIAGYGNKIKDAVAREAAKLVYQASEKTNKTAGDGTSATVIELAALYEGGRRLVVAGEDAMAIKRALDRDRDAVLKFVDSKSVECTREKLEQVAVISSGDPALGAMISDLVWDIGADGAITISYQNAPNVQIEKVTGYLFDNGFRNLGGELELDSPLIFVTQKRMASKTDIIPIMETANSVGKQFIIVGDVAGAALETLVWAIQNGKADGVTVPPPAYGIDGHDYFEDIATYVGARLVLEGDSFKDVKLEDFGIVKSARVNRDKAILFGQSYITRTVERDVEVEIVDPMSSTGEKRMGVERRQVSEEVNIGHNIVNRIAAIKEQLDGDVTPSLKEQLEQRLAKLAGKISIVKVGAATEVEREELFFRVEDAVEACKSALSSGIVAGGATTLLFASMLTKAEGKKQVPALEKFVSAALQEPFRLLMSNAGEDAGLYLQKTLTAGYGNGYNLRTQLTPEDMPIDLIKAGVVDATKVIQQVVKNAFSVAGSLLTTGAVITEVEDEPTKQA